MNASTDNIIQTIADAANEKRTNEVSSSKEVLGTTGLNSTEKEVANFMATVVNEQRGNQ